jgi:hypothetical protein
METFGSSKGIVDTLNFRNIACTYDVKETYNNYTQLVGTRIIGGGGRFVGDPGNYRQRGVVN